MKDIRDFIIFNLLLILVLWLVVVINLLVVKESQIVFLLHPYPEETYFLPRESFLVYPIAFSLIILYNLTLGLVGLNQSFINKMNALIFFLGLLSMLFIFFINY